MKPVKPKVEVPGDRNDNIMSQTGWIVGYADNKGLFGFPKDKHLVVWCFGFLTDSVQAKAYGVSVENQMWVLSNKGGKVLNVFFGKEKDLPNRFKTILNKDK